MSKKDGMYCYYDWIKPLKKVPAEDFKALFIAMLEYHKSGIEPPDFDGITGMAADFIFPQIERSKRYAKNGAKGGAATQSKINGLTDAQTNGLTLKHKHIQKTNTQTQTDTSPTSASPKEADVYGERFDAFWNAYPKKVGKGAAEKSFKKLKPSGDLLQRMLSAIETQKQSDQWKRDNGQYIPNPATWLNQTRWEDEGTAQPNNQDISLDEFFS